MTKNQAGDRVGGNLQSPPMQPHRDGLRIVGHLGTRLHAAPAPNAVQHAPISDLGRLAQSVQTHSLRLPTCEQTLWFSFFFDGTGNNLAADEGTEQHSNVAKLFRAHIEDDG
jgi:hypothetical protein